MSVRTSNWSTRLVPVLVLLVAAALIGFVVLYDSDDDADQSEQAQAGQLFPYDIGIERRDPADPLAFGETDALVTMVVFSDFQCPYCAQWSRDALPSILEQVDAGRLRVEMRDLSVFGDASRRAAGAAYAAALQDRYLDYHEALFKNGQKRSVGQLSEDALVGVASELGLDVDRFRTDMSSPETMSALDRSAEEAATVGAYSTPSFILGGKPIAGAGPPETYLDRIDALQPAEQD